MQLAITNMYIPPTFMFDMLVFIWSHILENLVFADPVIEIKNQIVSSYVGNIYINAVIR